MGALGVVGQVAPDHGLAAVGVVGAPHADLVTVVHDRGTGVGELEHRLEAVERRAGINAQMHVELEIELQQSLEEELFHISMEALNNALKQTGWAGPVLDQESWKPATRERVASIDWEVAERDVAPFLEPGPATALFAKENLLRLLEQ